MRIFKACVSILLVLLIVLGAVGCTSGEDVTTTAATTQSQVTLGTISNAVTGSATLGLAKTEDLTFEMAGYVESVLVEESETVTEGQVLAVLDPSDWEENIKTLESKLSSTQRTLSTREFSLVKARRVVETKELAYKQAELDLRSAQENLNDIDEVKTAQNTVDALQDDIAYAEASRRAARSMDDTALAGEWTEQIRFLNEDLAAAETRLARVLQGAGISDENVALQIVKAAFAVEQAEKSLRDARIAIEDARIDVDNAELDVQEAQDDVESAQADLNEEKALNTQVTAPFDGFITAIKISGGDEVKKGSVAMQIADPDQFEASFMVSESDIFSVKTGQSALITVDALEDAAFEAEVTAVAPLASVNSGVVSYQVTAQITSLIPVANPLASFGGFGGFPSGEMPSGFEGGTPPAGFGSGERPSGTPPADFQKGSASFGEGSGLPAGGNAPAVAVEPATLKEGLTATVTITIEEKQNVLIVPLRAITRNSGKTTVQVVNGENTETVEVTTGLSDDSNIEIVSGLTEGQTVIVKASGSSSSFFGPGGGMMMMR